MNWCRLWAWVGIACLFSAGAAYAQQDQAAVSGSSNGASAVAAVPRLIKYSGEVRDARGEPLGSVAVRLTFAVYEEQLGGTVLWAETQMVQLDEQGHYSVLLGATRADGLPVELFPAGKARWLGVQVEGRDEDPRVLLVSVPYALKAEDAAKLGGRSASDFVLTEQLKEEVRTQVEAQKPATTQSVETLVSNPATMPAIAEVVPSTFTCPTGTSSDCVTVTQNGTGRALRATAASATNAALVQQSGTGYGLQVLSQNNYAIYGVVQGGTGTNYAAIYGVTSAGTGTLYGVRGHTDSTTGAGILGDNAALTGRAYGLSGWTNSADGIALYGRAKHPTGSTTGLMGEADSTSGTGIWGRAFAATGATMGIYAEVWSASGTALVVNNKAAGKLLSGQAGGVEKLSIDGGGNLVSVGALSGTQLISTVASGTAPLSVTSNTLVPGLNADLLDGVHASAFQPAGIYATLGANTFTATQTVSSGDLSVSSGDISLPQTASASAGVVNLGGSPFIHACCSASQHNTFVGANAGNFTTTGRSNAASGYSALYSNNPGNSNTAFGNGSGFNNSTGSNNTFIGANAGPDSGHGDLTNATAIGANAVVSQSNSLILGGTGGAAVNVGIGTATPANILTVVKDSDTDPIADSWTTYSSRRWKTNIQTLQGALDKVERLRGVSYDRKADAKHEIGVIAEEVGGVVPELVAYEENGVDAKSVDYARLTALLIEAVKEQQLQLKELRAEVERLNAKLNAGVEVATR
jgi:hypothetical protein